MQWFEEIHKKYNETVNPSGWVIGESVVYQLKHQLQRHNLLYERDAEEHDKLTLMGLPYIVDTKNKDRIEIIS